MRLCRGESLCANYGSLCERKREREIEGEPEKAFEKVAKEVLTLVRERECVGD